MSNSPSNVSYGISFLDALQLILITLKLCGVITCSWWKVFIPMYFSVGILVVFLIVFGAVCLWEEYH